MTKLTETIDTEVPDATSAGNGPIGPITEKWLLTTEDLSFLLGLATITIKLSRKTGVLLGFTSPPHIKVGRLVRYRRDDVVAWIKTLPVHEGI